MNGQTIIGNVDWMRNDYISDVTVDGITYPSVEHAFQAAKFLDRDVKEEIAGAESVRSARRIGRGRSDLRQDWESVKVKIMELLIRQKFIQNSELASRLAKTGTSEIIMEGYDEFWGTGRDGDGENRLGIIFSDVRTEVQAITGIAGTDPDDEDATGQLAAVLSDDPSDEIIDACQQLYDGAKALMSLVDSNDYDAGLISRRTGVPLDIARDAISKLQKMQEAMSFISDELGDGAIQLFGIREPKKDDSLLGSSSDDWFASD